MTSRPGPGIHESLQHRAGNAGGGGPRSQVRRRPSQTRDAAKHHGAHAQPQDCIDPTLEDQRRATDDPASQSRVSGAAAPRARPAAQEASQPSGGPVPRPTPKGKPQLFFSIQPSHAPEPPFTLTLPSPYRPRASLAAGLPLPPRPGNSRLADAQQQQRLAPGGTGVKGAAAVMPPSNDPPACAPTFPGGKTADLFPWTGQEDVLSEALVKAGVSNKSQIMNETNTARPSLWSNLKNKSGLTTLSSLFVAVLEKRQASGRLTTPNSFKPPPRLTLRDSTRETWLHDLANPTVGLRRLSRTIPHGITGTVLLEHCLNKNIPLPRAVWLAKCVGINEMRSHKRKGQAGTVTWVRGWTSSVEQFLDSNITKMGQDGWKPRITYALQLTTSLYQDHLLEDDHFLDWILKNLESCPEERLFLWLLIASMYGADLTASRRRGKRLGESFVHHVEKLYRLEVDNQTSPLLVYLEKLLIKLLVTNPSCLLLPKAWGETITVLQRLASRHPHPNITRCINHLDRRAKRLVNHPRDACSSTQDLTRKVVSLLDSTDCAVRVNIEYLAVECMATMSDPCCLISTALDWASSLYRVGSHRVYLVTRLLRKFCNYGIDIDTAILSFFQSTGSNTGTDPYNIFRIVAELVRSKTFSVGKYLQWLIATGSLSCNQDIASTSFWPLRLIVEVPLTGLPDQVRNLRSTLLRGSPYTTEKEEKCLDDVESMMRFHLSELFNTEMFEDAPPEIDFSNLSSTIKLELALLLRHQVAASMGMIDSRSVDECSPVCTITSKDFHTVRSYLEEFGDLSILADIVGIVTTSMDSNVLASASDTLQYHQRSFRAIGAFEVLFGKITTRYATIRTIRFPERELLLSLIDLSHTVRLESNFVQALSNDLCRLEQMNSAAACSPVSDTMTEVVQNTVLDSAEEIDRILSSGTSMDRQIIARVFDRITQNLEEQTEKGSPSGNHAIWFQRLRSFDETAFDAHLSDWLGSLLENHQPKLSHAALPVLVRAGCVTLDQYSKVARGCMATQKANNHAEALRMCMDALDLLLPSEKLSHLCKVQEAYRYRLEQQKFCQGMEHQILGLIREMLELGTDPLAPTLQARATSLLLSKRMQAIVKHLVLEDVHSLSADLGVGIQSASAGKWSSLKSLLDSLLDPSGRMLLSRSSLEGQIKTVVETADCFSLRFCQLEIRHLFSKNVRDSDVLSAALLEAVKSAVEKESSPWSDLVAGLEADLTNKIREHAEQELLQASAFLASPVNFDRGTVDRGDDAFIQKYLTVIDFTTPQTLKDDQPPIFAALVDRFKGVAELLGNQCDPSKPSAHTESTSTVASSLCSWLTAFLRLAIVHGSLPLQRVSNQQQAALLGSLRQLFTHPTLKLHPSTTEHVFDVAIVLSDSISDDVRNHLAKVDAAKPVDDPRCAFLLGSTPVQDGWLALAKPIVPATNSQATSSPQPQAQQANKNPSQQQYQNQQLQGSSPVPMQRSLGHQNQQQFQAAQALNANRIYPQYPQHPQQNRLLSQFQRMAPSPGQMTQHTQLQQMQQMQQMQGFNQQRITQPSPVQLQRQGTASPQPGNQAAKPTTSKQENVEMRTMPFALKRWEILPESGGNPAANETAISLTLFGARKV